MKKTISRLLLIFMLSLICLTACSPKEPAQPPKEESQAPNDPIVFSYKINPDGKSCAITGIGSCTDSEIEIPTKIQEYQVTAIDDQAFRGCTNLTDVTIPDSVTSIGKYAFSGCTGLTSITIPNSVTSIDEHAFFDCTSLMNVAIGNSVTSIESFAFFRCTSLTSVTIPNSVTYIGNAAFEDCPKLQGTAYENGILFWKHKQSLLILMESKQ